MSKILLLLTFVNHLTLLSQQFAVRTSGDYVSEIYGYRLYTTVSTIDMDSHNLISKENANIKIFIEFNASNRTQNNQLLGYGELKIFKNNGSPKTYVINYGTENYNEIIGSYFNLYNFETKKGNIARMQKTNGKSIFTVEDYYMRRTYLYE